MGLDLLFPNHVTNVHWGEPGRVMAVAIGSRGEASVSIYLTTPEITYKWTTLDKKPIQPIPYPAFSNRQSAPSDFYEHVITGSGLPGNPLGTRTQWFVTVPIVRIDYRGYSTIEGQHWEGFAPVPDGVKQYRDYNYKLITKDKIPKAPSKGLAMGSDEDGSVFATLSGLTKYDSNGKRLWSKEDDGILTAYYDEEHEEIIAVPNSGSEIHYYTLKGDMRSVDLGYPILDCSRKGKCYCSVPSASGGIGNGIAAFSSRGQRIWKVDGPPPGEGSYGSATAFGEEYALSSLAVDGQTFSFTGDASSGTTTFITQWTEILMVIFDHAGAQTRTVWGRTSSDSVFWDPIASGGPPKRWDVTQTSIAGLTYRRAFHLPGGG